MRAHARVVNVRAIIMCAFYNPLKVGEKFLEMNISSLELSSEYPITKYAIPD